MAIRPDNAACIPWTRSLLIFRGASSPSGSRRPPSFCASGSRLMLFLAVGSSRFSSSVLVQFSSSVSSCWSICSRTATTGPQGLLLGAEVAVGADRRGVQVVLDQREAGWSLDKRVWSSVRVACGRSDTPSQLLQAVQPGSLSSSFFLPSSLTPSRAFLCRLK